MRRHLAVVTIAAIAAAIGVSAQSDLDDFMSQVLARRDENWKKLQQYILDEEETFQLTGPEGARLYGFRHEYQWFPRDGFFIRSPRTADGVTINEAERRTAEERWLRQEQEREKRRARKDPDIVAPAASDGPVGVEDVVRQSVEPQFVSTAYFLKFRFEKGHYAFAGRERLADREVLRIEYYPAKLFTDEQQESGDRSQESGDKGKKKGDDEDARFERKMNKVAIVTLWIAPTEHQILQYEFSNIDLDFLPGRSIVRIDELKASMRMAQAFPSVWLPDSIGMRFQMTTAIGAVAARYDVRYRDYRLASVTTRVR